MKRNTKCNHIKILKQNITLMIFPIGLRVGMNIDEFRYDKFIEQMLIQTFLSSESALAAFGYEECCSLRGIYYSIMCDVLRLR